MIRLSQLAASAILCLACAGTPQAKAAAPADQARQEAKAEAAFARIISKARRFFATPQQLVAQQTGPVFTVEEYRVDVGSHSLDRAQKPNDVLTAHFDAMATRESNAFCGVIPVGEYRYGWKSVAGAVEAAGQRNCKRPSPAPGPYALRFTYAYGKGKWSLQSVNRIDNGKPDWGISSALGLTRSEGVFHATEAGAVAFNRAWQKIAPTS